MQPLVAGEETPHNYEAIQASHPSERPGTSKQRHNGPKQAGKEDFYVYVNIVFVTRCLFYGSLSILIPVLNMHALHSQSQACAILPYTVVHIRAYFGLLQWFAQ